MEYDSEQERELRLEKIRELARQYEEHKPGTGEAEQRIKTLNAEELKFIERWHHPVSQRQGTEFYEGQLVQLKSGGPVMTVSALPGLPKYQLNSLSSSPACTYWRGLEKSEWEKWRLACLKALITCEWFDAGNCLQKSGFPQTSIRPYQEEKPPPTER